jgi:hypothetical protein
MTRGSQNVQDQKRRTVDVKRNKEKQDFQDNKESCPQGQLQGYAELQLIASPEMPAHGVLDTLPGLP